jgi:adenylate cyclase
MERRLVAILAADMVGYSRLMSSDESGTLARLKNHRSELIDPKIAEYGGRIVKTTGDGLLVEFPSVVDAVRCAVTIQLAMTEREARVPYDSRITYRVGINLGDIIVEDKDIFGDGVNVAARLEALAEAGGICVSRTVVNHVRGRVCSKFEDLGERSIKNIAKPVRIFRVLMAPEERGATTENLEKKKNWKRSMVAAVPAGIALIAAFFVFNWQSWVPDIEPASVEKMAFPLPDKPSLAVLPFTNLSDHPEQEHLADGITIDLITDLSKFKNLFVIAANSTFTYKGKPVKVQTVAEDLGVRYVLEGSVQSAGETIRINSQLIDAVSGHHLWAERYDYDQNDILALQNAVVDQVVSTLSIKLEEGERQSIVREGGLSPESYNLFTHARATFPLYFADKDDMLMARELFQRLMVSDPDFFGGYAGLSLTHSLAVQRGYKRTPFVDGTKALELAQKARELHADTEFSKLAMANALQANGRASEAIEILEHLVKASPNSADAHAQLGLLLIWAGLAEEAIEPISAAIRLNPYVGSPYLNHLGLAHFTLNQYKAAADAFEQNAARGGPIDDAGLAVWAASYGELGRSNEANKTLTRLIDRYPGVHLRSFWLLRSFVQTEDRQRVTEILRRTGIPMDRPYTR